MWSDDLQYDRFPSVRDAKFGKELALPYAIADEESAFEAVIVLSEENRELAQVTGELSEEALFSLRKKMGKRKTVELLLPRFKVGLRMTS